MAVGHRPVVFFWHLEAVCRPSPSPEDRLEKSPPDFVPDNAGLGMMQNWFGSLVDSERVPGNLRTSSCPHPREHPDAPRTQPDCLLPCCDCRISLSLGVGVLWIDRSKVFPTDGRTSPRSVDAR